MRCRWFRSRRRVGEFLSPEAGRYELRVGVIVLAAWQALRVADDVPVVCAAVGTGHAALHRRGGLDATAARARRDAYLARSPSTDGICAPRSLRTGASR